MIEASASREINVSADTAWSLLADWGDTSWLKGPEKTEVVQKGGQVTRRLHVSGADPIEETMLASDPATMTLNYTIAVSELFRLENYNGTIAVVPTANGCRVDWRCTFEPGGMSDEEAAAIANGNLNFLLDSLVEYLL